MKAVEDVLAERKRQIEQEGFTPAHDDIHVQGELAAAGACYALNAATSGEGGATPAFLSRHWPWHTEWWKPTSKRRDLVKAAALIIAEIEKMDRHDARAQKNADPQ